MATKEMIALKDFRYRTRRLRAGDPVEMSGPDVKLYTALGAVTPNTGIKAPKIIGESPLETANRATGKAKAPRKRATRRKKAVG